MLYALYLWQRKELLALAEKVNQGLVVALLAHVQGDMVQREDLPRGHPTLDRACSAGLGLLLHALDRAEPGQVAAGVLPGLQET